MTGVSKPTMDQIQAFICLIYKVLLKYMAAFML